MMAFNVTPTNGEPLDGWIVLQGQQSGLQKTGHNNKQKPADLNTHKYMYI